MQIFLYFVLTPTSVVIIVLGIISLFRHHQLKRTAQMLVKSGVKHAKVTNDQITF